MVAVKGAEILICGAGIIGLTVARQLLKDGYKDIVIIEKEDAPGRHASGRNSGVLHAGVYYMPDTLRAKSCLRGNMLMKEYCRERGLPLFESGKVIVAKNETEIPILKELLKRATANGARVELIDERQLNEIEPAAKTCATALYSYDTAVVDPKAVLMALYDDLLKTGKVTIIKNTQFKGVRGSATCMTTNGAIAFGTFINAAGAYSDKVAHAFGVGSQYSLVPFKGIYRKLRPDSVSMIRGSIYPVPDIRNPFLGVHFTRGIDGSVYLGPTAIPALGRENYGILKGIDSEALEILRRELVLFSENPKFREVAFTEPKKYLFKYFFEDARVLVKDLEPKDVVPSDKAGVRPQLVDWKTKELVTDFIVVKDGNSVHVLNSISPAFTSSMDFARVIVNNYIKNAA
ncbi:MAG: L-2-hydroxyglutarate oxidase [Nitrospirae bacterium]|nr:L-2-hydroxyglutarate oxidase [Nitrospirota bacterium]